MKNPWNDHLKPGDTAGWKARWQWQDLIGPIVRIHGVGPQLAEKILSQIEEAELRRCVIEGDAKALASLEGVGRKIAEGMIERFNKTPPRHWKENTMRHAMTDHRPPLLSAPTVERTPTGTLQDAGEVAVLTPNQGKVNHRFALVVAFESEEQLRQAIAGHQCRYREGQRAQELTHE